MRYLHPVGISERLVASGTYVRIHDNEIQAGWAEEWAIHQLPDQSQLVRIDEDAKASTGRSILTEAWVSPPAEGGQLTRIDFLAYGGKDDPIKQIRATYNFFEDHVEIGRSLNKQPRLYDELSTSPDYIRSGHAILLLGFATTQVAEQGGRGVVVTNRVDFSSDQAFAAQVNDYVVARESEQQIELNGKSYLAAQFNCEINDSAVSWLWLDQQTIPLRIDQMDGQVIELRDYVRAR